MNERTLRVLEYPKVKELLTAETSSPLGAQLVAALKPMSNLTQVRRALQETSEARLIYLTENLSMEGLCDILPSLRRAAIGAILETGSLLEIAAVCSLSRRIYSFFKSKPDYPLLGSHAGRLVTSKELEQAIRAAIDDSGEVKDAASSDLAKIRHDIRVLQGRLKQRLEAMIRSKAMQKFLQEPLITVRNDRYVLPIKLEYRQQVPGIIHDQSASGSTLFIEPAAAVEISNDLRRKAMAEEREVARILAELSAFVQSMVPQLESNMTLLAHFDLSLARGRLSYRQRATEPLLNDKGFLDLKNARHPLLSAATVVPSNISLGGDFKILLITGPNTGGKTVTLKTVGLLALMALSGLHVPADEGSELAVFNSIFADIGDEQSIEQNLSTFSSHMVNIIDIIDQAEEQSLILLDELGAGTDPTEGAALAMSIIDHLRGIGSPLLVTTHYNELKSYAYQTAGVQNASVEFDVETLRPTYRLQIGLPGKSNAFEIATRLGLDSALIANAEAYLSGQEIRLEDLLSQLEQNRKDAEADRRLAHSLRLEAEMKAREAERELARLRQQERDILEKAKSEARSLLQNHRQMIEEAMSDLRAALSQGNTAGAEAHAALDAARETMRSLREQSAPRIEEQPLPELIFADKDFDTGDEVLVKHLGQRGQLLAPPAAGQVQVQLGALRLTCQLEQIEKIKPKEEVKRSGFHVLHRNRAALSLELDIRGQTVDEALPRIDKYLDDAIINALPTATIIHGKGTGALRQGVHEFLDNHQHVASYRLGGQGEGGSGATVVKLQQ